MTDKALIITHTEDFTADLLVNELNQRNLPYIRFNTDTDSQNLLLRFPKADNFWPEMFTDVTSIWYRRIKNPQVRFKDAAQEAYFHEEYKDYLHNLVSLLDGKWLNKPERIDVAENKFLQLKLASRIGLKIPETLISADPFEISKFSEHFQDLIIKPIYKNVYYQESGEYPIYTSRISRIDIKQIVASANEFSPLPAIVQQRIEKKQEFRVIIVDQQIFSCAINPILNGEEVTDWRQHRLDFYEAPIPREIGEKLLRLLDILDLKFGAFDLIEDKRGEFYFLEINPNGQWGWLELENGMQISDAIITYLYE